MVKKTVNTQQKAPKPEAMPPADLESVARFCANCLCWTRNDPLEGKDARMGRCRRHAPTPAIVQEASIYPYIVTYPITFEDDTCFEGMFPPKMWLAKPHVTPPPAPPSDAEPAEKAE